MTGGVAFLLDELLNNLSDNVNDENVSLSAVTTSDVTWLAEALERHHAETGSALAACLLNDWAGGRQPGTELNVEITGGASQLDRRQCLIQTLIKFKVEEIYVSCRSQSIHLK